MEFFKKILKIKPNISVDFDISGSPSFKLNFLQKENSVVLKEVLELPFLGSKKSIMSNLFFDRSKPFYKSVKHIPIEKIDSNHWQKYIKDGFETNGKKIESEQIEMILEVSKGFAYYTQQIASELFNMTQNLVESDSVEKAIDSILEKEEDLFLNEWNHLSQHQKKALKFLIHFGGENIYQKEKMMEYNFTSSSLKKAVEGLVAKDVIDTKKSSFYLQDPLFELYLSRM